MATDEARSASAGDLVAAADLSVRQALLALDVARRELEPARLRSRRADGGADLDGRDIAIAITELEGVLLRLRHGSPPR